VREIVQRVAAQPEPFRLNDGNIQNTDHPSSLDRLRKNS
jgi:hypothetical protein